MKSFNILILLVLISSLFPYQISADNSGQGVNVRVERIQEGSGYFTGIVQVQSNPYEYKDDVVSVQDIKLNVDKYPLNVAVKAGNSVVVTTTGADIIATPHTLSASGWVQVDYKSKSFSGPAEVSFGFNGVDQVQMVKGETYESYEHTLTRQVPAVKTAEFKPTKIISTKTAVMPSKADTDLSLNSKYAEIVYEQTEPMMVKTAQRTIKLAYDTYDDKTGAYSYKYNGQDTQTYYETFVDWKKSSSSVRVENKSLAGTSKWNTLPSGTIAKDTWYSTRFWVEIPFKGKTEVSGKYNIAIKQAGADLSTAVVLDPWYNSSWLYRKSIGINCTTNQTFYQMKLLVGYNSTAVGENVDTNSHCNTTFADLRFTTSDEVTLMPYWIESTNTTAPYIMATTWVNVTSISSFNTTVIYMYYGNAGASAPDTPANMATATFLQYHGSATATYHDANVLPTSGGIRNVILAQQSGAGANCGLGLGDQEGTSGSSENAYIQLYAGGDDLYQSCIDDGVQTFNNGGSIAVDTPYRIEALMILGTTYRASTNGGYQLAAITTNVPTGDSMGLWLKLFAGTVTQSWAFASKYTANEPTWGSFGGEGASSSFMPTVTTQAASLVEETTATGNGNIGNLNSGGNATVRGIQYDIDSGAPYASSNSTTGDYGTGAYTINVSGLTKGELYYYRAYATNSAGTGYGAEVTFLTKPDEPSGFVCAALNDTHIQVDWVMGAGAANITVLYKVGSYPTDRADVLATLGYNGTATSYTQGGLIVATNYYFRGWSWVSEGGFVQYSDSYAGCASTTGTPPTVTTNTTAGNVEETTASLSGNVSVSPTNVINTGVDYGVVVGYGLQNNTVGANVAPYPFTQNVSSLSPGTYYYFRAFADNTFARGYGSQGSFLTKPQPPTGFSSSYVNTTAINLNWMAGAGATNTYIRYSNITYPNTTAVGTLATNNTGLSYTHTGLTSLNTYYYSAWSWVSANASTQYSDSYVTTQIIVPSGTPIVYTNASTGYGNDWGTVAGLVTATYPNPTLFGFQYGVNSTYLPYWSNTTSVVPGGIFSATLTGLNSGVTYYYRAFASNSYGIGYGNVTSFSTSSGGIGGGGALYESHTYGCNTTWSQVYVTTSANITSNYTATRVFGNNWTAQTFTTTQAHSVHQVVLWGERTLTAAAGYMYVSIREADTDNVTSPDLAIGLYAIAYVSTTGGPMEVSLENEIQLEANKKYAIVVRAPGADSTNYVSLWSSNTSGTSIYAGGNAIRSINGGGTWQSYTDYDLFFSIIGRPQPIYGNVQAAQTFTVGVSSHTLYRVRLILGRIGQPGNVYVSIRNYTLGVLSSTDLASVALNGNAITLDKASYDCVLVPEKSLEAGKQYAIVVTAPSGDRYNYILMCGDSGAGYAGGQALISINSGILWSVVAPALDYNFEIWGNACLSVVNAKVFKNYLTTGDWLITAEILNVSPPYYDSNENPSSFYIVSFMGLIGTTYASTPCELWNKSPVAIYLNPTQATALSWGGNYKVRVGDLAGAVYSEYALTSTDWNAPSLTYLDNWARLTAKDMEAYMTAKTGTTVTYLTYVANKGYCLNQDGGAIFNQACPRLSVVRPNLFQVTSNQPEMDNTVVPTPGATTATTYRTRLGSYIADLIDQGAAAAGVGDPKIFGGLVIGAIYFLVAFGTVAVGFAWAGIIAAFPIILMGIYYGLLDIQMLLVIIVILVFLFVREFFFKGG